VVFWLVGWHPDEGDEVSRVACGGKNTTTITAKKTQKTKQAKVRGSTLEGKRQGGNGEGGVMASATHLVLYTGQL